MRSFWRRAQDSRAEMVRFRSPQDAVQRRGRAALETEFLHLCRGRGPAWIESVIRPLLLPGDAIIVQDIPTFALAAIVRTFGRVKALTAG